MNDTSTRQIKENSVASAMRDHPGRWIAWDNAQGTVIAIADTYADALREAVDAGESEPEIEKASGFHPAASNHPLTLLADESQNIIEDVKRTIPDPDDWLETPNTHLWFEKPQDLIGTGREPQVRYLLRGIRNGITT